jgi:hypothetical protein
MKLVNPRMPNAKFALPEKLIEADANGVVDVPEEFAEALLKSGYVKIENFKPEPKAKPEVSRIASESIKAKEEMLAKQAEAAKVSSQSEEIKSEDAVTAVSSETGEAASKRGWKRGK